MTTGSMPRLLSGSKKKPKKEEKNSLNIVHCPLCDKGYAHSDRAKLDKHMKTCCGVGM